MKKAFVLSTLLLSTIAFATDTAGFAGRGEMNGLSFEIYKNFPSEWKQVTVRFRKDTNEMRLVYANEIAWKALQRGATNFPDGSAFGKVGSMTEDDPLFTSSAVPSGARRFQLMLKTSKAGPETDGWSYALFDGLGKTFPEDPKIQEAACHACHRLAASRGFVFSLPLSMKAELEKVRAGAMPGLEFDTVDVVGLPTHVRKEIPKGFRQVQFLKGDLRQKLFQGTLDEIRPTLGREALKTGRPALLMNLEGTRFSLAYRSTESRLCSLGSSGAADMIAVFTIIETTHDPKTLETKKSPRKTIRKEPFCQTP